MKGRRNSRKREIVKCTNWNFKFGNSAPFPLSLASLLDSPSSESSYPPPLLLRGNGEERLDSYTHFGARAVQISVSQSKGGGQGRNATRELESKALKSDFSLLRKDHFHFIFSSI